jgi:hypothetical protein
MFGTQDLTPEQFRELAKNSLQLNIEADFFPVNKSIFAKSQSAETITTKLIKRSAKILDEKYHFDPLFYLLFSENGQDKVFGMNMRAFVDNEPIGGSILAANIMSMVDAKAYATVFVSNIARRKLHEIRDDRTLHRIPARGLAVASIAQFQDGDKSYRLRRFGQSDDIVFWESKDSEKCSIPDHAIPGRFWNLFYIANQLSQYYSNVKNHGTKEKGEEE